VLKAVRKIRTSSTDVEIELSVGALFTEQRFKFERSTEGFHLQVLAPLKRSAAGSKIVVPGRAIGPVADPAMLKAVARGHAWFEELVSGRATTVMEIARREKVTDRYVSSLMKLAFVAPAIVENCLCGEASQFSGRSVRNELRMALLWGDQPYPE
jgi:hypothetical protein